MPLDWSDFSTDSDTDDVSLLVSIRTQSLVLTALECVSRRWQWQVTDDATWDDIDAAVASAYNEIMRLVMLDSTPIGTIQFYIGTHTNIGAKWLICAGQSLDIGGYPDLAAIVHPSWIVSSNIVLPDLRDKFLFGADSDTDLGNEGGAETHTLTVSELPAHTHTQRGRNASSGANLQSAIAVGADATQLNTITTTLATGDNEAHNNMPPYVRGYWIIKVFP